MYSWVSSCSAQVGEWSLYKSRWWQLRRRAASGSLGAYWEEKPGTSPPRRNYPMTVCPGMVLEWLPYGHPIQEEPGPLRTASGSSKDHSFRDGEKRCGQPRGLCFCIRAKEQGRCPTGPRESIVQIPAGRNTVVLRTTQWCFCFCITENDLSTWKCKIKLSLEMWNPEGEEPYSFNILSAWDGRADRPPGSGEQCSRDWELPQG